MKINNRIAYQIFRNFVIYRNLNKRNEKHELVNLHYYNNKNVDDGYKYSNFVLSRQ